MPQSEMALSIHSRELREVDTVLSRAITAGDPLIATEYGNQLSKLIKLKGIALAKLLFGMKSNWALFRVAGIEEEFGDFINAHMNITSRVGNKYADMYEAVFVNADIKAELKDQLANKPMKELLLLTAAVREGAITTESLEDVPVLDYQGIRSLVRTARGEATNSHTAIYARLVQVEESQYPQGSLVVFGPNAIELIGHINLDPITDAGKKYLERMKNLLGWQDIR